MRKLVFLLVIVGLIGIMSYRLLEELAPANASDDPTVMANGRGGPQPALLVEADTVVRREFDSKLEVLGELRAQATVEVMSRISGRLEAVLVDRGDEVTKGQLVAVVEDAELQQQIRRSEAAIAVARAAARREEATVENLKIQLSRFQKLHDESLISIQDLQDLQSRVRVAESQLELVSAQVTQAEATLHELKIEQQQTRIYSPLDGVVGTRYLEPGALVSPSLTIVSVLNLDRVKTILPVPERALETIRIGLPSEITVDAYPDRPYSGRVTRISPFLNPETRSADIEIEFPNPGRTLKPGMFARVRIDANITQNVLSIPRSGLLQRGSDKGVYRLSSDLKTVFQPIEIGRIQGDFVEVLQGLEESSLIVTTGAQNLNAGDAVRLSD